MVSSIVVAILAVIIVLLIVVIVSLRRRNLEMRDELMAVSGSAKQKIMELSYEIRDTWDHLPRSLPICNQRRQLAQELGYSIPRLYLEYRHEPFEWSNIDRLVGEINDPVLSELWKTGERTAILGMLRTILFQPVAPEFHPDGACMPDGPMRYGLVEREIENS